MSLPAPEPFVAPSGLHLATYAWGGDGPPALLAHPTGFHGLAWAPIARRLLAAGRSVWSFDFRGHGESDRAPSGYDWKGFTADALAVAQHLDLAGDPSLLAVGHSKGAASLLVGEADEAGTYARIWAYEPIVYPSDRLLEPFPDNPRSVSARRRRAVWTSPEEAVARYASRPPLDVFVAEALRAYVEGGLRPQSDGSWELKCRPDDEAEMYAIGSTFGAWTRLGEIDAPVLVACGALTDAIGPTLASSVVGRLPNARLEVFEALGHFGPMQDPDACVASMLIFAAETGVSG